MKTVKVVLSIFLIAVVILTSSSCKKCKNESPRARIINNGTKVADVQIKTSGGNTENINGIAAGTASAYRSFAPGETTFTINVDKVDYVKTVQMSDCFEYDIAIDSSNNITTNATDRND